MIRDQTIEKQKLKTKIYQICEILKKFLRFVINTYKKKTKDPAQE